MDTPQPEPIAIIGSACRFPGGASSPSKLWNLLHSPRDLLTPIPPERFDPVGFYHPNGEHHGASNVQHSYLLEEDPCVFDAPFFALNAREAEAMDPQHRILLETVYECLENAGSSIQHLQNSQTGVYVGLMTNDYHDIHLRDMETIPKYSGTGTTRSILSNRVSYFFNWKGPSMTIDTACSSSLVAVHLAVQSLRSGETSVAIAAGANLIFGPEMYIIESKLHMLSPQGRSRMWDDKADGYGRGEGVAAIMLKTLSAAIRDGDHIECVIRNTGVNQDGRTPGITMPSPLSQEALIRETYRAAGLDLTKKEDRPQFFEAHGTGTPVGDPLEAEAISRAFFGADNNYDDEILYVGGIKTIIGHLEGAAGLAGLLKASLALQRKIIPPNMHLDQLNPKVMPFTKNLRIPTEPIAWPAVSDCAARRASVNSFGFGGTNAHAILESYGNEVYENATAPRSPSSAALTPLVFSANSDTSLVDTVRAFTTHIEDIESTTDLLDLAWTLQAKRTELSYRKSFVGASQKELITKMQNAIQAIKDAPSSTLGTRSLDSTACLKILGVFTGQGAQWPAMGAGLLESSTVFSQRIHQLEESLHELSDGPTWSLRQELSAVGSNSGVHLAEISQPLCTAVQIGLVDLLRKAGVRLCAVVGHSSGEIGAAYAAGVISAHDAIRVAYYRGMHAKHAAGKAGQMGSMMAVGASFAQAQALCEMPQFAGCLSVAASNAPSTVTISGDKDAIDKLKVQLDQKQTFARILKVDKAYHSHHMLPCVGPYLESLKNCDVQVQFPYNAHWVSSVHGSPVTEDEFFPLETLSSSYWVDNMTQPVLFSQAVERAVLDYGPFDVAIEIGPHTALKGPTTQIIKALSNTNLPYHGTLNRENRDETALASSLGLLWERFGSRAVQLGQFTCSLRDRPPVLQKDIPGYQWDHRQRYWKESRLSKNFRQRSQRVHELLGTPCSDNVDGHDLRWRNILDLDEMPWLRGHKFQHEVLFPAAGHVALALEASRALANRDEVELIELEDITIGKAITLDESGPGVEILFSLKRAASTTDTRIVADFSCYACPNDETTGGTMDQCSSGRITLHLRSGWTDGDGLPPRPGPIPCLVPVDTEEFYDSMTQIGLDYTEEFRKMKDVARTRHYARSSTTKPPPNSEYSQNLMVHPAMLDMCFQTVIAAFCYPGDGSFWTPYLPTSIDRIRVNPRACMRQNEPHVEIEANIVEETSTRIVGDLGAYSLNGQQLIQLEGLACRSFAKETAATDRLLFAETIWNSAVVPVEDGTSTTLLEHSKNDPVETEAIEANERVAFYYLRTLHEKFTSDEVATFEWWYQRLFEFADQLLPVVMSGSHLSIRAEWANDTYETVQSLTAKFPDQIDLQLIVQVGENLPTYVRGTVPLLEVMMKEDRLTRLYQDGLGVPEVNRELSAIAKQLSHQYPNMNILEIGAGTGGMTMEVLRELDGAFGSYTFTDISNGFFEKAQARLQRHGHGKMKFSALDIEKDPFAQAYTEGSYDVIIASNVLHATRKLSETVANARRLLRPGGYLLLNEVTGDMLRLKFIMSGLPGWWLGGDDGRRYAPTINPLQWDETLRNAGFSGVDIIRRDYDDPSKQSLSVMVSQAIDEMVDFLREPLLSPYMAPDAQELFIVGGKTLPVHQMGRAVINQLRSWTQDASLMKDLIALKAANPMAGFTVVCLDDLDEPFLQITTPEKLQALQFLFSKANHILYVTRKAREDSPYSMAMYGLGRTMMFENPDLRLQFIDITKYGDINARIIAEELLRLVAAEALDPSYLWIAEPEIAYLSGQKQIQRVVSNRELNNRLNSDRRLITESLSEAEWQFVLGRKDGSQCSLRKGELRDKLVVASSNQMLLHTLLSVVHPLGGSDSSSLLYLSVGKTDSSSQVFAVISSELASSMVVPATNAFAIPEIEDSSLAAILKLSSMRLLAQKLVSSVWSPGSILLHDPDPTFADVALRLAAETGAGIILTTSNPQLRNTSPWIWVHPHSSRSQFEGAMWSRVRLFVNFAGTSDPLAARIAGVVGQACLVLTANQLLAVLSQPLMGVEDMLRSVAWASTRPKEELNCSAPATDIQGINDSSNSREDIFSVFDWRSLESTVTVPVLPTMTDGLFSSQKTYILFGLSGEIGRSMADYMVDKGAHHIVLTSRHPPKVDAWAEHHRARGVTVKLLANDITQKQEVQRLLAQINVTMPPIGGVVNGAMVLQDKLFSNMNLDDWNAAVRPKIEGSRILDECFAADYSLEFFIMLSSLASVIGNSGQSNYNAGNMYCCGLAANRRKRGLAASVIDIGKIVGIGYVARNHKAVISLRSHKFQPISEPLFHQMLAEAVISGRPHSSRQPVLTSGMQKRVGLAEEDSAPPLWLSNPRFSHMKWEDKKDVADQSSSAASARIPVKDQLKAATQADQAESILCTAFTTRLAAILQMSIDSIAKQTPLVDVGIDSLIAVEVRSWFLKELNVDVPVLKVIGGASILDICREVLSKVSLEFEASNAREVKEQKITPIVEVMEITEDGTSVEEKIYQDECIDDSTSENSHIFTPSEGTEEAGSNTAGIEESMPPQTKALQILRSTALSHAQERLWVADCYGEDRKAYNVAFAWKFQGYLDIPRFESALQAVIHRHDALHTAFRVNKMTGEPEQFSFRKEGFVLQTKTITSESDVHSEFVHFRNHEFDLVNGETMKATVLQISHNLNVFMLCYHHIVMDGISLRTFLSDLNQAYLSCSLPRPTSQYLDYVLEERKQIQDQSMEEDIKYWKQQFSTAIDPLPLLPLSRINSRPSLGASHAYTAHAYIKQDVVARVKESARRSGSTSFHFYTAVLQTLLFQLLDGSVDEFCFGIADANRHDDRYLDTVGFFLNLLPVRLRVQGQQTVSQLIKNTRSSIYDALAHSKVPFDVLLKELNVTRSSTHSPLFQVLFNYTLGIREMGTLASCKMDMVEIEDARTGCDLVVSIVETVGQDTALSFTMLQSLYLDQDCARLIDLYVDLVDQLSELPDKLISDVALYSQPSLSQNLDAGCGPRVETWDGWENTISRQVDIAAQKFAGDVAVKLGFTNEKITYAALDEQVGRAAQALKDLAVGVSSTVSILSEPSADMIIFILATLRVGAAYAPLDPRNPHIRLSAIISDSSPSLLLCDSYMEERATSLGAECGVPVKGMVSLLTTDCSQGRYRENLSDPNLPAFILYTSGSTGTPKGVTLNHRNWVNQLAAVTKHYGLMQEVTLQQSSPGFDIAIEQVFIALCNGGTVVLAPSSIRGDAVGLARLILEENITYTIGVPSEYSVMLYHGAGSLSRSKAWKYAFCGGEKMTDRVRMNFKELCLPQLRVINVYGPTEITVSCCRGDVPINIDSLDKNNDFCPVGHTLPNYQVHIIGSDGHPVPTGFPGEIYISGTGVGQGYLNQANLTTTRFLRTTTGPSRTSSQPGSDLMYRTGDRGRLLNDGSLVFLGRLDGGSQIKLRGQRIELDEIAHVLLRISKGNLANAQVSARGGGTEIFLVAFVVFDKGYHGGETEREAYLKQLRQTVPLPRYMCPAALIPLTELPLGLNGKIDRKALDAINLPKAPESDLELQELDGEEISLLALWHEVLPEAARVGLNITKETDFFAAGGNSLSLVRLQASIKQRFGLQIPLVELVEFCSLEAMACRLRSTDTLSSNQFVWEDEASVPEVDWKSESSNEQLHEPTLSSRDGKVVILTGASGFLGQHILQHLVLSPAVSEVHCIAVRSEESAQKIRAIGTPKAIIHTGDLTHPRLGLDASTAKSLASRTDIIIHNAADVSFIKSYISLKVANVNSTAELVRLSAPRRIPIHFISSAGVAGFLPSNELPLREISVAAYPPPVKYGIHGYQAAKWVSERLLEKASERYELEVLLHRPTGIIGEEAPNMDILGNLLRFSQILSSAPDMDGWDGYMDLVDVDVVARRIVAYIDASKLPTVSGGSVQVVHTCNPDAFSVHELAKYLEQRHRKSFHNLPMNEWIECAMRAGMSEMVGMYLKEVTAKKSGWYPPVTSVSTHEA